MMFVMIHTNSVLVGDFSFEVCIISYHIILNVDSVYAYNNIPTMCHSDLTQVLSAAGGLLLLAAKMKPKDFALLTGCTLGCPAATFRTTFFGQSSGATGPVCRTIRKASWPWAIDSSGRRLPWDVCRLCHAVPTLCHAVPCCAMARAGEADLLLV